MARCTVCHQSWSARTIYRLIWSAHGLPCPHCQNPQHLHMEHQGHFLRIGYLIPWLTFLLILVCPWYAKLSHYASPYRL
ncbi:hypothetical protein [Exiguobacterium indicum]|uniref:hypothetical protein n=1 Tax=Exiguobacterium indicum TaxID=296995 RepID=UPI000A957C28|nr:hypothetical protein [Exiguobacterium indicum]